MEQENEVANKNRRGEQYRYDEEQHLHYEKKQSAEHESGSEDVKNPQRDEWQVTTAHMLDAGMRSDRDCN